MGGSKPSNFPSEAEELLQLSWSVWFNWNCVQFSVSLQDINLRKAFKCTIVTDQQVLASCTIPSAMEDRYSTCDKPPRLQDMNSFRDDNKDALKFYTDPTYFFELWCEEMRKETEKKKKKRVSVLLVLHPLYSLIQGLGLCSGLKSAILI